MTTSTDTNSYLEGVSILAAQGFASIQAAVDAILRLMTGQLGMRSGFLAHIKFEEQRLVVLAAHNMPGGCDIEVGTAVPLPQSFAHMMSGAKRPSPHLQERLQRPSGSSAERVPGTFSRIGSYIGVPIALTDGAYFGVLGAADPEPHKVKPEQPAMLAVFARRLANEIEHDYELTERKRAQAKLAEALLSLKEANKQLQELNKQKSDFISIVSHEFRTALTSIGGFSEIMRDEDFSMQEMKDFAADIHCDTMRLSRMISDMLDLDRIESGKMTLHREQIAINVMITEVVDRTRLTTPDHVFHLQLADELPMIAGDRDKLIQVLTNLLSNAVKYSPAGGEILLRSCREDDFIHVQVRDHGVGIPPDQLERVFERFSRLEAGTTGYIKGTGLGLAIVRQIVQMHGGKVWVESTQAGVQGDAQGSTFHLTLPITGASMDV